MTDNFDKPTVIVTGGSSGLGYAIAERFLAAGNNIVLNGRDAGKLAAAAARLASPGQVATVAADMTQPLGAAQIVEAAVGRFGRVDVLVNNAGNFSMKSFTDYSIDELDSYLGYLRGTFVLSQAVVRQMRQQGDGGAIVNIGTILTFHGNAYTPSSAPVAAKGGITALSLNLAVELARDRIRVNLVAPGTVPTPLYGELGAERLRALNDMQPLGRYGTPQDIAEAVFYLANATWITGVVLPVDGGIAAGGAVVSPRAKVDPS